MNKRSIWTIVGVMGAAVIGLVWLQTNLIRTSMRINEERFDKNVFEALNATVVRLEEEERRELFQYQNGFSLFSTGQRSGASVNPGQANIDAAREDILPSGLPGRGNNRLFDDLMVEIVSEQVQIDVRNTFAFIRLEDRVQRGHLPDILKQELQNRGIRTTYNYGVLAAQRSAIVFVNDQQTSVKTTSLSEVPTVYSSIYSSLYKVLLYPGDLPSPGLLLIDFPGKSSEIWLSLWKNLAGMVILTSIILLCFAYTVKVIFEQKKLSEMKTDFVNNMTHEFKTPIATISVAVDAINSPLVSGDKSKVQRFANIIKQENRRMNSQVEKVLQMAQLDRHEFSMKLSPTNLHELIENALENISLQVDKKEGQVSSSLAAENPVVEGDALHIANVINNLLDNANKYSPEKPEISIHTRNVAKGVEVIVSDKGIGMSKEARKHIFDKFYRVHTGNLHDVKGFGLGLAYVKAIMVSHNGQVEVKSELGKGSSFVLFFPHQQKKKATA